MADIDKLIILAGKLGTSIGLIVSGQRDGDPERVVMGATEIRTIAYALQDECEALRAERDALQAKLVAEPSWRHIANEWADELCNASAGVQNIQDGIQTAPEVRAHIQRGIERCRALGPESVTKGWQLVPVEPTEEMLYRLEMGEGGSEMGWRELWRKAWQDVLAVAPRIGEEGR